MSHPLPPQNEGKIERRRKGRREGRREGGKTEEREEGRKKDWPWKFCFLNYCLPDSFNAFEVR